MATFPTDQFDNLPDDLDRVGAHRGPKVRGRGWIGFAWALLATAVLVVAGLYVLSLLNKDITFTLPGTNTASTPTPSASASQGPLIIPITDPRTIPKRHISITVLNGTAKVGLASRAGAKLRAAHWVVGSVADASETTIKQTVVYYGLAKNEDVAQGIALALGTKFVRLTDAFKGATITVVLGSDFKG